MTRDIKYLVLALAMATAGAVSPPTLRGVKDAETVRTSARTIKVINGPRLAILLSIKKKSIRRSGTN